MKKQKRKLIISFFVEDEKLLKASSKNRKENQILIEDINEFFQKF